MRSTSVSRNGAENRPGVASPSWAIDVAAGLAAGGVDDIVFVPDNPLSHILGALKHDHPHVRQTLATREEEAVGIAAGLYLGGRTPAILMQSSGLGNATNAMASLLIAYQVPAVFVMSMRGDPGEWNWAQVPLGRAIRPILDALGVPHLTVERADEAQAAVLTACATAYGTRLPVACLLPRRLTAPVAGRAQAAKG